ncbi:deoxyribose-phosphate aldolase [Anaerococcus hydrogenalis]|uniref:Deoxyribose-phosphate aldolase n=1 Tax=Anaerococcus hydrogenalis TaxID=33029 RepID=A0A2N6UIY6_9FIRM|nr:deoxyribose-phosphate aldolase [Anaerococcus hydrogenalis]MBS5988115.1 deoxyribose-phosphate aldolase [Anaerococcus hydrogenalis]MDK7694882.1 deoxyribose-phosphate aldolase [Anaerococcus hydrogenalis]MDK7696564.1 deoxyribose-phosphate aldolase [Anaerococcus hydrogenalis]MDK7707909.1 deoxyribose-phosphate aldolase [Anaerococcus hydrogenalis]PMC81515.1 deoxyribose-phosphate aldolase [Anaerococcus hydrogenalis]
MENKEIFKHIDHTLLKAYSSYEDIKTLCDEAVKNQTASVCIPQTYIKRVKDNYPSLNVCTVIGFPLGYNSTKSKIVEAENAMEDGASEIDMVINISDVKNGDYQKVEDEIKALRKTCQGKILKVIVETCYLTDDEKIEMCKAVTNAKANYIKTSTGFGTGGAKMEDILLFKKHIGEDVKIKASGGVKSKEDLIAFIEAGCDRIGTSSAVKMLTK